jgi:Na+-exporting ATPase
MGDVRLVESVNFETDEALLTGESLPVHKDCDVIFKEDTSLNIAYSSSVVTRGRARGVVISTGMSTEIGKIAAALKSTNKFKRRPVKRDANGKHRKRSYIQAWTLTGADQLQSFLGTNVGTPLQRKLSALAIILFGVAVLFAIVVMSANLWSSSNEVILYAVATGLSMIPASLVLVLTATMAAATKRMVKRHVIVRKLDSLEALGAVTNICSDKTGTLTQGKMVVTGAWIPSCGSCSVETSKEPFNPTLGGLSFTTSSPAEFDAEKPHKEHTHYEDLLSNNGKALEDFLNVASMANLAHVYQSEEGDGEWHARGEPTEIAIQVFASRFNWNRDRWTKGSKAVWHQKAEFPFDSDIKMMSVIYSKISAVRRDEVNEVFTKGAVERVLDVCNTVVWERNSEPVALNDDHRRSILHNMDCLSQLGLRVLALAHKPWRPETRLLGHSEISRDDVEENLCFLGLVGLYDPPRPETEGAIERCGQAGVSVHMLTGDHSGTAQAIAQQVGILPADFRLISRDVAEAMVMTAGEFDKLSDEEVDKLPTLPLVIARCTPQTKVRMINALHRRGGFVAMTGDGVNDSPSLKHADVGIAMGQNGSDVAKDASDIVLSDDNFASILNAVEEGRRIFDNIQKFVLHLLSENVAQACILLIGLAFQDKDGQSVFPLSPVEILWVIMVTSLLPDMGLGQEAAATSIMQRPPQSVSPVSSFSIRSKLTNIDR